MHTKFRLLKHTWYFSEINCFNLCSKNFLKRIWKLMQILRLILFWWLFILVVRSLQGSVILIFYLFLLILTHCCCCKTSFLIMSYIYGFLRIGYNVDIGVSNVFFTARVYLSRHNIASWLIQMYFFQAKNCNRWHCC